MARPLRIVSTVNISFTPTATTTFFVFFFVVTVFATASLVSFLCTSRKLARRGTRHEGAESRPSDRKFVSTVSKIGSKAHLMAKMISWRKEGEEEDETDEAVWRKTIMLGDRCRPLDFSGRILYDADGNPVMEQPNRTPGRDSVTAAFAPAARS